LGKGNDGCKSLNTIENVGAAFGAFCGDIEEDIAAIESNDVYND